MKDRKTNKFAIDTVMKKMDNPNNIDIFNEMKEFINISDSTLKLKLILRSNILYNYNIMLNSSLIKSLCQISALVYKPNSFVDNYVKKPFPKGCECFLI